MRLPHLVVLACLSSCIAPPESAPRPHIVMILADDLGWGDVGYHGSAIRTPHLDALAARGTRLEQFYVQPVCSPTRGAFLTGRYPFRLGLQCGVVRPWATHGLPLDERTLPDALREIGYRTAICGKWHLGHATPEQLPMQRGFDYQYGHYNGALDYFTHVRDGGHDWHENDRANHDEGYATDLIADAAARVIAKHDKSRPLFLYVPFNAPHTPLQAPKDLIEEYSSMRNRRRRVYAAMVASLDAGIGRIQKALDDHGFPRKETLVIFCSDNGGIRQLGSNGDLRAGKGRLYEGGIRVPAIVAWEGALATGKKVAQPLHIVDLYPTLLKLAGASPKQKHPVDGRDAWATIARGAPSPHDSIIHNVTPFAGAIREGDWKIVHNGGLGANATSDAGRNKLELFDLAKDPGEKNDVSAQHPEVFARLSARLDALRADMAAPHILPNKPPEGFRSPKVWGEAR